MKRKLTTILWVMLMTLMACVDQLAFPLPDEAPNLLIVDGFVSNLSGPHTIRLTRSAPFRDIDEGGIEEGVNDAIVEVYDFNNDQVIPLEISDAFGRYQTPKSFQGESGNSYQLRIRLADGTTYESDREVLPEPGILDSIHFGYNSRPVLKNGIILDDFAVEGLVDYRFRETGITYYLWDWELTYHFEPSAGDICYVTEEGKSYSKLVDNEERSSIRIENESVMFEQADFRFFERVSFRAIQYTTTKEMYAFFKKIQQQDQQTGSIFDPTPATIQGNLKNTANADEVVLGYFAAFSIAEKRTFIRNADIPGDIQSPGLLCGSANPPKWCGDCRCYIGSTDVKPDFWD